MNLSKDNRNKSIFGSDKNSKRKIDTINLRNNNIQHYYN